MDHSEQATDPAYWARHLRTTVRFSDCLSELLKEPARVFLEVGPGSVCCMLLGQHPGCKEHAVLSSIRHAKDTQSDQAVILNSLGRLWLAGISINWTAVNSGERRRRLPLPTYPFERKRYWVQPGRDVSAALCTARAADDAPAGIPPGLEALLPEQTKESRSKRMSTEDLERTIVAIWKELLGVDHVSPDENFFDLGGTSLIALRMLSRMEQIFDQKLPLSIFKAPTIRQLVSHLMEEIAAEPRPAVWTPELSQPNNEFPGLSISV